jgi:two-component system, NarL family, nitrate/nitrite response regulator NarL
MPAPELSNAEATVRVFVVCGVRLYRDALARLIGRHREISVVGAAEPTDTATLAILAAAPHVVLIDVRTAEGLTFSARLVRRNGEARVLGFGVEESASHVIACAEAGLVGYVPSSASIDELVGALRHVARGGTVCSASMASGLFRHVGRVANSASLLAQGGVLTQRQRQIAQLLDDGLSNKEIARRLSLGASTVKNHVHNILGRLNVARRGEAAARVRRQSA